MNDQPAIDDNGAVVLLARIVIQAVKDARHGDLDAEMWLDAFTGASFDWRCAGPRGPAQRHQPATPTAVVAKL